MRRGFILLYFVAANSGAAVTAGCQRTPSLTAVSDSTLIAPPVIETLTLPSEILGETRKLFVALPASYGKASAARTYPVIVVVDGEELTPQVASVAAHLTRMGQIPESIIVGIENTDRLRDLTPPGISVSGSSANEGGDRFVDFIEKELLPAVDARFKGGLPRTFVGHSSGGIIATWIAATRTSFNTIVAIDTPVHLDDNWIAKRLVTRAQSSEAIPMRYVSLEARFGWTDTRWKSLTDAAPKSWRLHREKLVHENHESMAMLASYIGLREAFADYSMLAAPRSPTTSILPYYAKLDSAYGARLIPPRKLLLNVIEDLNMEGRGAEARAAYNTILAAYGAPRNAAQLTATIAEVEKRPPPKETVEGLLATPFSTPAEARAWIGEWIGDSWMNPDEPRRHNELLRIEEVDGRIVAKTIYSLPDGEKMVQDWTYFRVSPGGMSYGYMNGMRPRGMLIHEGKLVNGVFSGEMRFGGVNVVFPDGTRPPPIHFSFRKR